MAEHLTNDGHENHDDQPAADSPEPVRLPEDQFVIRALMAATQVIQTQAEMLEQSLARQADLYEKLAVERERREIAERDSKTELLQNEAWIRQVGRAIMLGAREADKPVHSIMLLDIDSFKAINDSIGHLRTDRVLYRIAECIRASTREEDILGRFGGDELVVFLKNTTTQDAVNVGMRIQAGMRLISPEFTGLPVEITASIGVAELRSGGNTESEIALAMAAADRAVYHVKRNGRDDIMVGTIAQQNQIIQNPIS